MALDLRRTLQGSDDRKRPSLLHALGPPRDCRRRSSCVGEVPDADQGRLLVQETATVWQRCVRAALEKCFFCHRDSVTDDRIQVKARATPRPMLTIPRGSRVYRRRGINRKLPRRHRCRGAVPEKSRMRRFNSTKVPRSGNRGSYSHVSSRQITISDRHPRMLSWLGRPLQNQRELRIQEEKSHLAVLRLGMWLLSPQQRNGLCQIARISRYLSHHTSETVQPDRTRTRGASGSVVPSLTGTDGSSSFSTKLQLHPRLLFAA